MARSNSPNLAMPDTAADRVGEVSGRPLVVHLLISLRPHQWTKNLLVLAPLGFAVRLHDPGAAAAAAAAFVIFCALSGAVYLVNDVADRSTDRLHPLKRHRPIAAGALPVPIALAAAASITVVSLAAALWL